ncbi:hypothetical protein BRD14_02645 [Halobacteriales archaeon SW_5_68_122]|nr:MAG: hypothetical protein BRD14_02645 [Halobacteriales archaeon SW_5_68_122]
MFDATTLAAYLVAAIALILSPGPDTVYVLARGAGEGRRAGVLSALGVATGVLVHTVAAAVGLAALFRAVPEARTVVVAAGAAYLSYLGVQTLRDPEVEARETDGNPYLQGLTVNILNPQVALFFLARRPAWSCWGRCTRPSRPPISAASGRCRATSAARAAGCGSRRVSSCSGLPGGSS